MGAYFRKYYLSEKERERETLMPPIDPTASTRCSKLVAENFVFEAVVNHEGAAARARQSMSNPLLLVLQYNNVVT